MLPCLLVVAPALHTISCRDHGCLPLYGHHSHIRKLTCAQVPCEAGERQNNKMFRSRSRCFVNKYKDFSGSLGSVEYLRDLVRRVLQLIEEKSPPERASTDGGLYVGGAGIGYAFYAVAESSAVANIREQCLRKALEYMKVIIFPRQQ